MRLDRVELDVIAGTAYGQRSPVGVLSPTLYVHARLDAGAQLPVDDEHEERAVSVVEGQVKCEGRTFSPGTMFVLRAGAAVTVETVEPARVMLVGGAKLEGPRHIWWNFVSSSQERIEQAKAEWRERRFAPVKNDEVWSSSRCPSADSARAKRRRRGCSSAIRVPSTFTSKEFVLK